MNRSTLGRYHLIMWCQFLAFSFLSVFINLFCTVRHLESRQRGKPRIIVANHPSSPDPFILAAAWPFFGGGSLKPYVFMTHPYFLDLFLVGPFIRALGAFPSHPFRQRTYGVAAAKKLIEQGFTLVIFPQGKRTQDKQIPAKWGVLNIAHECSGVEIVPVHLQRRGWRYTVVIGRSFAPTADMTPADIMDRIYALEPYASPIMAPPRHSSS